jgi:hypothetical protein
VVAREEKVRRRRHGRRPFSPELISTNFYVTRTPIPDFSQAIRQPREVHYFRRLW